VPEFCPTGVCGLVVSNVFCTWCCRNIWRWKSSPSQQRLAKSDCGKRKSLALFSRENAIALSFVQLEYKCN
jgi:hypothetical protein